MKVNRVIEVETNDGVLFMEEVFAKYEDTAGESSLAWHGNRRAYH